MKFNLKNEVNSKQVLVEINKRVKNMIFQIEVNEIVYNYVTKIHYHK